MTRKKMTVKIFLMMTVCASLILSSCAQGQLLGQPLTATPLFTPTPAISPTPALLQVASLHSFCVSVSQDHAEGLTEALTTLLQAMGYQVMKPGEPCDASLELQLSGEALSASYQVNDTSEYRTCYTGANFKGTLTLSAEHAIPLVQPVLEGEMPPSYIRDICPGEEGAPYQVVWAKALVFGLKKVLGDGVVIGAVQVPALRGTENMTGQAPYPDSLVQGLISLLDNADPDTSARASQLISYMRPVPEAAVLAAAQRLPSDQDNSLLWGILLNADAVSKAALPQIIDILNSSQNSLTRQNAVRTLAGIGPAAKSAASALVQALQDPDASTRMLAARALGEILAAPELAVQPLINLLGDADTDVQQAAGLSLSQITAHPELEHASATEWQQWWGAPPTPTPVVTPVPEAILTMTAPESFAAAWRQWNGKYVVYVHFSRDIQQFSDLDGKSLAVAFAGNQFTTEDRQGMIEAATQLAENSGIAMYMNGMFPEKDLTNFYTGGPDYSTDFFYVYFMSGTGFVAFMLPEVAKYYHFDQNPDLLRVEFK
jgi:hypothetical protein